MNKTEKVYRHLKRYKSITSWTAIQKYGATRLSDIIYRLRKRCQLDGYAIVTIMIPKTDRYRTKTKVARYQLLKVKK